MCLLWVSGSPDKKISGIVCRVSIEARLSENPLEVFINYRRSIGVATGSDINY